MISPTEPRYFTIDNGQITRISTKPKDIHIIKVAQAAINGSNGTAHENLKSHDIAALQEAFDKRYKNQNIVGKIFLSIWNFFQDRSLKKELHSLFSQKTAAETASEALLAKKTPQDPSGQKSTASPHDEKPETPPSSLTIAPELLSPAPLSSDNLAHDIATTEGDIEDQRALEEAQLAREDNLARIEQGYAELKIYRDLGLPAATSSFGQAATESCKDFLNGQLDALKSDLDQGSEVSFKNYKTIRATIVSLLKDVDAQGKEISDLLKSVLPEQNSNTEGVYGDFNKAVVELRARLQELQTETAGAGTLETDLARIKEKIQVFRTRRGEIESFAKQIKTIDSQLEILTQTERLQDAYKPFSSEGKTFAAQGQVRLDSQGHEFRDKLNKGIPLTPEQLEGLAKSAETLLQKIKAKDEAAKRQCLVRLATKVQPYEGSKLPDDIRRVYDKIKASIEGTKEGENLEARANMATLDTAIQEYEVQSAREQERRDLSEMQALVKQEPITPQVQNLQSSSVKNRPPTVTTLIDRHAQNPEMALKIRQLFSDLISTTCPPDVRNTTYAQAFIKFIQSDTLDIKNIEREYTAGITRLRTASETLQQAHELVLKARSEQEQIPNQTSAIADAIISEEALLGAPDGNQFDEKLASLTTSLEFLTDSMSTVRTAFFETILISLQRGKESSSNLSSFFKPNEELEALQSEYLRAKTDYEEFPTDQLPAKLDKATKGTAAQKAYFDKICALLDTLSLEGIESAALSLSEDNPPEQFADAIQKRLENLKKAAEIKSLTEQKQALNEKLDQFPGYIKKSLYAQSLKEKIATINGSNKQKVLEEIQRDFTLLSNIRDRVTEAGSVIQQQQQLVNKLKQIAVNFQIPLTLESAPDLATLEKSIQNEPSNTLKTSIDRLILTSQNPTTIETALATLKTTLKEKYKENEVLYNSLAEKGIDLETARQLLGEKKADVERANPTTIEEAATALKTAHECYEVALQACLSSQNVQIQTQLQKKLQEAQAIVAGSPGSTLPTGLEAVINRFSATNSRSQNEPLLKEAQAIIDEWTSKTFLPGCLPKEYREATISGLCIAPSEKDISLLQKQLQLALTQPIETPVHQDLLTNIALTLANNDALPEPLLSSFKEKFIPFLDPNTLTPRQQHLLATINSTSGQLEDSWIAEKRKEQIQAKANQTITEVTRILKQEGNINLLFLNFEGLCSQNTSIDQATWLKVKEKLAGKLSAPIQLKNVTFIREPVSYLDFLQFGIPHLKSNIADSAAARPLLLRNANLLKLVNIKILPIVTEALTSFADDLKEEPIPISSEVSLGDINIERKKERYAASFQEIKKAEIPQKKQQAIDQLSSLFQAMGYGVMTEEDVNALCIYVQQHGSLPKAISHVFESPSNEDAMKLLSHLLFTYASFKMEQQHFPIATINDLGWLFQNTDGSPLSANEEAKRYFTLLQTLKQDSKLQGCGLTKQQAQWGLEVKHLLEGKTSEPIYGEGGSGKTVSVKLFLTLLPKCAIGQTGKKILMLSPFADRNTDPSIHGAMLSQFSGNVRLEIPFDPENTVVIIDEAHLLEPNFSLTLVHEGTFKQIGSNFLKMTATPITAPFASIQSKRAIYESLAREASTVSSGTEQLEHLKHVQLELLRETFKNDILGLLEETHDDLLEWTGAPQLEKFAKEQVRLLFTGTSSEIETAVTNLIRFISLTSFSLDDNTKKEELIVRLQLYAGSKGIERYKPMFDTYFKKWLTQDFTIPFTPRDTVPIRRSLVFPAPKKLPKGRTGVIASSLTHPFQAPNTRALTEIEGQQQRFGAVVTHMHQNLARLNLESGISDTFQGDQETYRQIAALRSTCLSSIDIQAGVDTKIEGDGAAVWSTIASSLHKSLPNASRIQVILPFLKNTEARLHSLHSSLQQQYAGKNVRLVFHDSHSDPASNVLGKDRLIQHNGSIENLDPSWTPGQDDVVFMVYDSTNKQGGDFGALSQNSETSPQQQIEQFTFLNLKEREENPISQLTESDLYQALRRRRGIDSLGPTRHVITTLPAGDFTSTIAANQKTRERLWAVRNATERVASILRPQKAVPKTTAATRPRIPLLQLQQLNPPDSLVTRISALQETTFADLASIKREVQTLKELATRKIILLSDRTNPLQADLEELQKESFWASYSNILEAEKIIEWAENYRAAT